MQRISKTLSTISQTIANVLLGLMLILVFVEVVSRYVFSVSHGSMEEIAKWAQIWVTYFMVGVVEKARGHINVDIFYSRLPKPIQAILFIIFDIAIVVFGVLLFWSGVLVIQNWKLLGYVSSAIPVPLWVIMLSAPLGACLLIFFALEHLITDFRALGLIRSNAVSESS